MGPRHPPSTAGLYRYRGKPPEGGSARGRAPTRVVPGPASGTVSAAAIRPLDLTWVDRRFPVPRKRRPPVAASFVVAFP
jgi:hypothetical protein